MTIVNFTLNKWLFKAINAIVNKALIKTVVVFIFLNP